MNRITTILVAVVFVALVVAVAGLAALVVLDRDEQAGPTRDPERAPVTVTPSGTAATPPDAALRDYYTQKVVWQACPDEPDHDCAFMEAPLDYADPGGERISIALLRVPAGQPGRKVGSLVVNPGGPGAPGTDYAASGAFPDRLTSRFDMVGFDPRGTGDSTNVDCLSDAELDAYVAEDPSPDTPAEEKSFTDAQSGFWAGCVERSGELASHVTTVDAARDMDILRAVLGEDRLDYFGASYGTQLGATYAELFPKKVGRFVLDGAVDVSLPSREKSLQQAAGFQTALEAYVDDCIDRGDCFLGSTRDAALARIASFLEEVDAEPLPVGNRQLTVGHAFYGIVTPLYDASYWSLLSAALRTAFGGDGSTLLSFSDIYHSRQESGRYSDNSTEAFSAISCVDDPWSIPLSEVPNHLADFEKASPTFGRVFAYGLAGCHGIQARSSHPPLTIDAAGAAPLLVIGTTRDPATPMQWARALAAQLKPAILVTRDGDGHTGYNAGNGCVDGVVESYLLDGKVPSADVDCPASSRG